MAEFSISLNRINRIYRLAVSLLFFLQGLCFATWASRIPSIKALLHLSDASLGLVLLALPVGSMIGLPFSGWLVTRFGSKTIASSALLVYSLALLPVGLATSLPLLICALIVYGMAGNIANIAINTQAIGVEVRYNRNIMASFHGLWSLAGFAAAGIGSLMIGLDIKPLNHFLLVSIAILAALAAVYQHLLPNEEKQTASAKLFVKPDKPLMNLGIIAFCCMMCEGAMFDWSGVYFQKIVRADRNWIGAGYTAFMLTMASGRFVADWVVEKLGFRRTVEVSGLLIAAGLLLAVAAPYVATAIAGFFIVGFGVSSVVPLVYSQAGKTGSTAPGMALAAVSSVGFVGFLVGPPLIGLVAGLFSLRISMTIIALIGLLIVFMVKRIDTGTKTPA